MKGSSSVPSITDVLKKVSDDKALTLFNSIAVSSIHRAIYLTEMNLSKKQYYSRLSGLMNAGLIRRDKGKYSLTLVGKIVYDAHLNIGKALSYYWKLKAIESIENSPDGGAHSKEELKQLINALIDNHFIKDFLIKDIVHTLEGYHQQQHRQSKEAKLKPPTAIGTRTVRFKTASTNSF